MFAFAHSDIENSFLHALGDVAVLMTIAALVLAVLGLVREGQRQRARGASFFSLIALLCVILSFWNGGFLLVFLVASLLAMAFSVLAAAHLVVRPFNWVEPLRRLHVVRS